MKSRDFCYWLQGFFEMSDSKELDSAQVAMLKRHLAMVFATEIDPSHGDDALQKALREIHSKRDLEPISYCMSPATDGKLNC